MTPETGDETLRELYRGMTSPADHPDEDMWVRLSTGALDDAARTRLVDHIVACASCASIYRALDVLRGHAESTDQRPDPLSPASPPARSGWRGRSTWLAAAAIALAVTAVVLQTRTPSPPSASPGPTAAGPALDAGPAALGTPAPSTSPAPRAWASTVDAPPVELPARYALVVRGPASKAAFMQAFGPAIAPYREGRYAEAARALDEVARDYPDTPEAAFYLGVARLLGGDASAARQPLARAESAETLGPAARWYGAVAAERSGDAAAADAALRALCTGGLGEYRARACAALDEAR